MNASTVSTPSSEPGADVRVIQERYAARIKARLARPGLDVRDARDGILDCFVATYYGGVAQGLQHVLGVRAGDDEVARVTAALFRKKLREKGVSFEAPTTDALAEVKEEVDRELHVAELPAELRGIHDQVCSLLLAKADGALPHAGDRSVVKPAVRSAAPAAPAPAPRPSLSLNPPGVSTGLRAALSAWLRQLADGVDAGVPVDELGPGLDRAHRLVETVAEFER